MTIASSVVRKRTLDCPKATKTDRQTDRSEKERCPGTQEGNKETESTCSMRRTIAAATIGVR